MYFTFGQYEGEVVEIVWRDDRQYCEWLLDQPWFIKKYRKISRTLLNLREALLRLNNERSDMTSQEAEFDAAMQSLANRTRARITLLENGCLVFRPLAFIQQAAHPIQYSAPAA